MKKRSRRTNPTAQSAYAFFLISLFCAVLGILAGFRASPRAAEKEPLRKIGLTGVCRINGGPWQTYDLYRLPVLQEENTLEISGFFTQDIPPHDDFLFYLRDLKAKVAVGGRTILKVGEEERIPFLDSTGIREEAVSTDGISRKERVTIVLAECYRHSSQSYRLFLGNIKTGHRSWLYREMIVQNGSILLLAAAAGILGLCCLISSFFSFFFKNPEGGRTAAIGCCGLAACLCIFADGNALYLPLLFRNPAQASVFSVFPIYLLSSALSFLFAAYGTGRTAVFVSAAAEFLNAVVIGLILLQLFGIQQLHESRELLTLVCLAAFSVCFFCTFWEGFIRGDRRSAVMLLTILPCLLFAGIEGIRYYQATFSNRPYFATGCILSLFLQMLQVVSAGKMRARREQRAREAEKELLEQRTAVMLSQMQPHFLFNVLTAIHTCIRHDPKKAEEAVCLFSDYLRGSVDSLSAPGLVPFEAELERTRRFLQLEEICRGIPFTVDWQIETADFCLPSLTLQPIVENAIRHGLLEKGGGTITVRTHETEEEYLVAVRDDGMGSSSYEGREDGRSHVGIRNVRERLLVQCGGTLTVEGKEGEGTEAVLKIPKKEEAR